MAESTEKEAQTLSPKEQVKRRILAEQAKMKIRDAEGEYKFDNPDLERGVQTKR